MKPIPRATLLAALVTLTHFSVTHAAHAAEPLLVQRLALCQDSWLDWQKDEARMAQFVQHLESQFDRTSADGAFTPKRSVTAIGAPVTQIYPQSMGMGVGFSAVVQIDAARARAAVEEQIGKPLRCSTAEGVRSCEAELGSKKTVLLMTGQNGAAKTSLLGCYYFYQP